MKTISTKVMRGNHYRRSSRYTDSVHLFLSIVLQPVRGIRNLRNSAFDCNSYWVLCVIICLRLPTA